MERCPNDNQVRSSQMKRFLRESLERPEALYIVRLRYNPNQTARGTGNCIKNELLAQIGEGRTSCSGTCGDCGCRVILDSIVVPHQPELEPNPPLDLDESQ